MESITLTYNENDASHLLLAIGVFTLVFVGLYVFRLLLVKRLERYAHDEPKGPYHFISLMFQRTSPLFFLLIAFYAGSHWLKFPPSVQSVVDKAILVIAMLQAGLWMTYLITLFVRKYYFNEKAKEVVSQAAMHFISSFAKMCVWVLITLLLIENFGWEITPLIAGLGIGGIAIALSAQSILGDLFASLSIVVDKPFHIGDFIVVDDYLGSVEHIGMKTTRLRSLSGEQLVFSNADLLKSRIRNYKRMKERRVVFTVSIPFGTENEKVRLTPTLLQQAVEKVSQTRFDRAHLKEIGEYALVYEVVYYVLVPDYNIYMDKQQAINFDLIEAFGQAEIPFAYPTAVKLGA